MRSGTHDATCDGPTLSGVVFRIVEGEMRPLNGQRVGFYSADGVRGTCTQPPTRRAVSNSLAFHAEQDPCWPVTAVTPWTQSRLRFTVTPMWTSI